MVVLADISLARKYDIHVQNLPLLCRELLERSDAEALAGGGVTLTETHMAAVSKAARDASEEKKIHRPRPVVSSNVGKGWRTQGPLATAPKPR